MPNKNGGKQGTSSRRSPRLSIENEDSKPKFAHPLGTPGTSRQVSDKKRLRSEEEIEAQKRECRSNSAEVRGNTVFYNSHEIMPEDDLTKSKHKMTEKNQKAISGVCMDDEEEEASSFKPKHTSTDYESSSEEEMMQESRREAPSKTASMNDLVRSMAMAFQTTGVQDSIRTALEPHFNKIIISMEEYKAKTDDRILKLETEVQNIKPLEEKVASLQNLLEEQAQEPMNLNLIITGLEDTDNLKDQCLTVASEQLEIDPYKLDIIDVKKLPPTRRRQDQTRYRIRFGDILSRTTFYKARTKATCKIWMNEDLCPPRSKLAYQARQAVFFKKAIRTWTYLGKIFIILTENAAPTLITRFEQLPIVEKLNNDTIPKQD